ncbi:hypothetical protein EON65_15275 [archaeon]|nr:MAG: hypothetical protein EON65_15275 [archaeon]
MEIFDVEGIKTNLRSEKAAFRKQGRAMFDSMISQMGTRSISALDALGLIQAVMEYEGKEKQAALSKGKALGHDVAEFFRRVARFALRSGHLLSKHTGPFMNHILSILSDTSLTDYYKSFHKSLLLDILVPRLTFSMDAPDAIDVLDTAGLKGLLLVLSKAFKDAKTRKDSSMLKVLRSTCSCLYMDIDTPTLEKLVQWIYQLACDESERDYQDFTVLMYTAECYTYLLQYHALNILPSMLENYKGISQLLQKAFALCHFKDPQIDTLIGFISVVLNLAKNMTSVFRSSVTYMQQEILHGWSGIFLSDYSLPILCASIQKRLNKELKPAYWATISYSSNIAEPLKSADSKVLLVFRTIAGVLVLSRGSPPAAASEDESTQLSQPSIQSPSERRPLKRHKTDSTSQNAWDTLTLLFGNLLTEYRQVMGETKKKSVLLTHYSFVSCLLSHTLSSSQDGDCVVYHQMICILSKMLESCALVIDLDVTVQDWLSIITSELLEKLCNKDADQSSETFAVMFEKDLVSLFFILCRCLEGYAHRGGVESGVSEFCRNVLITVLKIISSSRITYSTAVGLFEYLQKNSKSLVKHIAIFDRLRIMSSADILGLSLDICAIADILQLDIGPLLSHSSNSLPSFTVEHGSAFLAKYLIIILSCLTRIDIMPGPQLLHTTSWTSTVTKEECTVADDVLNSLIDYNDQRMNICSLQSPNLPELALSTLTGLWIKAAQCVVDDQEGHNHLFIPLLSVLAQLATSPGYINLSDMHHLPQLQEHICACVVDHMIRVEKQDEANSTLNADCINLCNIFSLLPHTTEFDGIMQTKLEMMTELLWHKILNPIAPVAQEPLHVMDIDSLAMSESPNVDPFNLVANALSARNQPRGSIGQGMYKSNVVSVDLATLVVRLMCAVSSSFCFLGEDFQARCSFLDRCLPVNTAVKISTDTMFALAEAAALDGNFVVFQYMIEGCVAWKKEWGPLGYGRILRCLLHIIGQVKDFQIFDYVYNLFDYVISFAIPEDAEFNRFSSRYWFVRAYQVEIIAAIMKSKANMSDIKTNIADLFSKYISDADIRVQHVTACHCSLLAVHFKNKHKVYESLYQNSSHLWIDLLVRGRKRNVLLHLAIQLMVCCSFHKDYESNSSLKYRALLDIMTSCATMHAYVADEVYSKKLRDLQITAIGAISNTQASLDANCCVAECLMHSWLGSKQACPPLLSLHHDLRDYLTLSTFPYPFLKANGNYNITQAETLHLNLDWLLPAICSVQPTQLRWEVLCSLCEHIKIAASDENIANLLKGNIISIKAAEYFAGFLSHSHEEKNICSYYQLKAQYMSDFTERTIRSSEIANLLKNDVTSLLCSLLQRMVFYDENTDALSPDRPQHKVDWTSIERISAQTSNFLESVAKGIGCKDVVALVGKFNVHHVLCSVVKCFKATQSISAVVVIMSILRIVMQCDTIFASQRLSLVILELLDCIIQYVSALPSSGALEDIFKLLFQVAFDLIKLVKSVNDSIYVLSFLHRALSRTRLSTISTEFKSFLQGYHHSSVIHPLELSSVNAKDVQRQLRALHSSYDGVEVWPALIEYCCDPPQEPQQLVVTCSFGSLIEKLHIVAAQCCDGHPIGFGTLWLLVSVHIISSVCLVMCCYLHIINLGRLLQGFTTYISCKIAA